MGTYRLIAFTPKRRDEHGLSCVMARVSGDDRDEPIELPATSGVCCRRHG